MRMACFDGLPLHLDAGGAVILLGRQPSRDWLEHFSDGIDVRVASDSRGIRVEGLDPNGSHDELTAAARDYANRALDLMAVRSIGSYALADQTSPFIWWGGAPNTTIRIVGETHTTFSLTIGGPPSPRQSAWHESMRYFRMSQTTTDLFDAFRNLYLALESILSTIAPVRLGARGRPAEGESAWTRRALGEAAHLLQAHNSGMTFDRYLDAPSTGDPVDAVFDNLYRGVRSAVFHAKNGRVFALPQNHLDREQIADALERYVILYTDLVEPVLGVRFLRSGLASAGFAAIADGVLPQWTVGVSSKLYKTQGEFDQVEAATLVSFATTRAPLHDRPLRAAVLGTRSVAELPGELVIRSIGARTSDEDPVTVESIGGALTLEGACKVEYLLSFQVLNSGAKSQYDS
jgi:hypothetical protein